jgi:hypothetical protein
VRKPELKPELVLPTRAEIENIMNGLRLGEDK